MDGSDAQEETEKDDGDDVDQIVNEQEELRKNMAIDDKDFLTLQQFLQDPNSKVSETGSESKTDMQVPEQTEVMPKDGESAEKLNKDDKNKAAAVEVSDENNTEDKENDDTTDDMEEKIQEEERLMKKFAVADDDDKLALQELIQNPNMDMVETSQDTEMEGPVNVQETGTDVKNTHKVEEVIEDDKDDEDIEEDLHRMDQFSDANEDDYFTLQEILSNPHMQEMEVIENDPFGIKENGDFLDAQIEYENYDENDEHDQGYGEHLDQITSEEKTRNNNNADDEMIKFEEGLEHQFNMADSNDMLSLEEMIQNPSMDLAVTVEESNNSKEADGEQGVFSLTTSFVNSPDGNSDNGVTAEIDAELSQLPEIAKQPIADIDIEIQTDFNDESYPKSEKFVHPAEQLKEQTSNFENNHPMNLEEMAHKDKMMLISLLHLDNLKVNKLQGINLPVMKPWGKMNATPKDDIFDAIQFNGKRKYCLLPKDSGPCTSSRILQWHYDPIIKTCLPFFYGGCKGNWNRFDTIGECLRKCGK
jgi:hypothetical protein